MECALQLDFSGKNYNVSKSIWAKNSGEDEQKQL